MRCGLWFGVRVEWKGFNVIFGGLIFYGDLYNWLFVIVTLVTKNFLFCNGYCFGRKLRNDRNFGELEIFSVREFIERRGCRVVMKVVFG